MRVLHMDFDSLMDAVILQSANHFQSGAIADMRQARIFVAAEISLQNAPVFCAIEHCAPGFEFAHAIGRFLGVQFSHAPLIDILAAAHRIGEVDFPIVAIIDVGQRRGNTTFGHDSVSFAEKDLQTIPTETPAAEASMAARRPAPPAPMTRTSCWKVSYSGMGAP